MANELGDKCVRIYNTKIKFLIMQTARLLQAAALMLIMALAASCATSNQYVSKLFTPRPIAVKDTQQLVRFLELSSLDSNEKEWVKTDITKKDTSAGTTSPIADEPIAKTGNPDSRPPDGQGTRNKRTRE
jgi:hypothetical protein